MENEKRMKELLNDIKSINDKYDNLYRNTGKQFNIFKITNMSYKEVHICQVIKELIDPKGSHYQGDIYFRLFAKYVLKIDNFLNEHDYEHISVVAEQVIPNERRIDIYIEIGNKFAIPIEAKIGACDLDEQCSDYFKYASARDKEKTILYYLTLDGREPSSESVRNVPKNNIQLISFRKEIIAWLNACLETETIQNIASVREVIIQLIDVLREITGQKEVDMAMEIKELIKDKDAYKSAVLLSQAVFKIDNELRHNILQELDNKIKQKYDLNRTINTYDFKKVTERSKRYQGCCYNLGSLYNEGFSIALRIAFSDYLYAEICLLKDDEIYWEDISEIVDSHCIVKSVDNNSKNSINWKDFIMDENKRPNFDYYNDAYYALIEEENFNKFITTVMKELDIFLSNLINEYKVIID